MPFAPEIPEEVTVEEVRTLLEEAADYLVNIQTDGDRESASYQADVRSATEFIYNWDAIHTAITSSREPTMQQRIAIADGGPTAATQNLGLDIDTRSIGERVVANESYTAWVRRNATDPDIRSFPAIEIENASFQNQPLSTRVNDPLTTVADSMWLPVGQPQLPRTRQRRLFVRDVLSVVQTTLGSVPYIQELNPLTTEVEATTVAEGSPKPQVDMYFTTMDAPIRKIAAWIPATNEVFADAPLLRGYVDTRLNYMLAIQEENQVLNGDGNAPNIRGILETVGLQTQGETTTEATGGADFPGRIGVAIGKIENVDGDPDAVIMNPLDFWKAVTTRQATDFDNSFGGPNGAPNIALSLTWGLPTIRTRAMTAGTALVGSFRLGATLLDRQRVTIRSSDSHSDYFTSNKVVVLAEERVGLAVHRPDFFVEVDVATAAIA